jgi:hypothetical protein
MRVLTELDLCAQNLYREYMAFPDDLPDLRTKKVPRNSRPDGIVNCHFARRERGELADMY